MTGGTADYLKAAKDKGAGEVLQKPFDNKTLLDTVAGLLAAH